MTTLHQSMNILKINNIQDLEVTKFVHFYNQKRFLENFNMSLKTTNQFHSHQTRYGTNENYYSERVTLASVALLKKPQIML